METDALTDGKFLSLKEKVRNISSGINQAQIINLCPAIAVFRTVGIDGQLIAHETFVSRRGRTRAVPGKKFLLCNLVRHKAVHIHAAKKVRKQASAPACVCIFPGRGRLRNSSRPLCFQLCLQILQFSSQNLLIHIHYPASRPLSNKLALVKQNHPIAVLDNTPHIMSYHQYGSTLFADFLHTAVAFGLEKHIAHRQSLIHDQYLRIHIDGKRKCQTDEHTAGIGLYRLMHKVPDLRKLQDILKLGIHLFSGVAHHGTIHIYIFNSGIVHIKTGSKFQKSGNLSVYIHLSRGGSQYAGNDL